MTRKSSKIRRRHLISGLLGLLTGTAADARGKLASARSPQTIEVSTVADFFRAIGSNRTIKLTASRYNLSELNPELRWTNAFMEITDDGYELVISGVENLKIESLNNQPAFVATESQRAAVLHFKNCRNITLSNLELGHWPNKGSCSGCVLTLSDCESVQIDKSILFGSGSFGVLADNTRKISITNSIVKECTYGVTYLEQVSDFIADQCQFYNNTGIYAIIIVRESSSNIAFKNCHMYNNAVPSDVGPDYSFFDITKSQAIRVENCTIENNSAVNLANDAALIKLIGTPVKNNNFKREFLK